MLIIISFQVKTHHANLNIIVAVKADSALEIDRLLKGCLLSKFAKCLKSLKVEDKRKTLAKCPNNIKKTQKHLNLYEKSRNIIDKKPRKSIKTIAKELKVSRHTTAIIVHEDLR